MGKRPSKPQTGVSALHLSRIVSVARRFTLLGLGVGIVPALALNVYHRPALIGIDFHTYAAAATVGLQDGWSKIYDQTMVATAQRDLVPGDRSQPFLSPPPVA